MAGLWGCGIGYGVTKDEVCLGMFFACMVLYLVTLVSRLVSDLYYENREWEHAENRQGRSAFLLSCRFVDGGDHSLGWLFL